jgi:hypothetical protein
MKMMFFAKAAIIMYYYQHPMLVGVEIRGITHEEGGKERQVKRRRGFDFSKTCIYV